MKNTLFVLLFGLILGGCSLLNATRDFKKSYTEATAQRWAAGAAGGGRGVTFRIKFYKLAPELISDTLWVNNLPLETEITRVGDTTYYSSFFFTDKPEEKSLATDHTYTGKFNLYTDGKKHLFGPFEFDILPMAMYE